MHTGQKVAAMVEPAPANAGITINGVQATANNVTSTDRATTIGGAALVEHLLSAAFGLGVENLSITIKGPELPALDGSALPWVEALVRAGIVNLAATRDYLIVQKPVQLPGKDRSLSALPYDGFKVDFMVKFVGIGEQFLSFDPENQSYAREIAPARTFGYVEEYEGLKARGLALGASAANALILSRDGYQNEPRFPDELVRHKVLDLIGDLALLGRPLKAWIKADRSGHQLNAELVRRLING